MAELPDAVYDRVTELSSTGNDLMDAGDYDAAIEQFTAAWNLLPEPKDEWEAATWLLAGLADAHFFQQDYRSMRPLLMQAMQSDEARANPFLCLRLGQCLYELNEQPEAANWLAHAYLEEGIGIFEMDDPKYLKFVNSRLSPPPGGWPEG